MLDFQSPLANASISERLRGVTSALGVASRTAINHLLL